MPKFPFMKFYHRDYFFDTRTLSLEERGSWMDLICHLWDKTDNGKLTMSLNELMGLWGVERIKGSAMVLSLQRKGIKIKGDPSVGPFTIYSKRIMEDKKRLSLNTLYVSKHRVSKMKDECKVNVRGKKSEVRSQNKEERERERERDSLELNTGRDKKVDFKKGSQDYEHGFNLIKKQYPGNERKSRMARFHFEETIKNEKDLSDLWVALRNYKDKAAESDPKYTKDFGNWMAEWKDWIKVKDQEEGKDSWFYKEVARKKALKESKASSTNSSNS